MAKGLTFHWYGYSIPYILLQPGLNLLSDSSAMESTFPRLISCSGVCNDLQGSPELAPVPAGLRVGDEASCRREAGPSLEAALLRQPIPNEADNYTLTESLGGFLSLGIN